MKAQGFIFAALAALGVILPAHASNLFIAATFDSSITSLSDASAVEAAINTAITTIESSYSTNITVPIYFQAGGGLGQSNFFVYEDSYQAYYNALVTTNADPAAIAALNASGGDYNTNGNVNPVGGTNEIELKSANARAVGINIAPGCYVVSTGLGTSGGNIPNTCTSTANGTAYDGIISLNTAITFPPNPNNGSYYDLVATAEHEIDEILGLGSALENISASSGSPTTPFGVGAPEDLFRFTAATGGTRSTLALNCASPGSAYFAYGPNTGAINQFNNACNGGDFGDWSGSSNVQDAFASPGTGPAYSSSEKDALSAIGYGLSNPTPEPGTLGLLGASLLALGFIRTRRTQK
jgi:hypothetical protein